MQEYIVTVLNPNVWIQGGLLDELRNTGTNSAFVPSREVEVTNYRPFNEYCFHFNLTDQEANLLRQDPRVEAVDLRTDLRPELMLEMCELRPARTYDKSNTTTNIMKNWGLPRCNSTTNVFGTGTSLNTELGYNLDGADVDIIVIDSGIAQGHPEFAVNSDGTGGSRVIDYNWYSLGVPGTPTSASIGGYLGDSDGHGSNCASIAAGNTCGWAIKSNLYSIRIFSGPSITNGSQLGAMPIDIVFDLVKAFHLNKIANNNTRPTICTNSWGYTQAYSQMSTTFFRGQTYSTSSPNVNYGQVYSRHPARVSSVDAALTSCANSGVILVGAAGNARHKCDVVGGIDYDDYYTNPYGINYYMRGMSPSAATGCINVGAIDNNNLIEQKVYFSECGPRVDVYTPGTMIMGAYANKSYVTPAVSDPRNPTFYLNKISGTSQACPQVTGILALALQARPNMTPSEALDFITKFSAKGVLQNATGGGFSNYNSLQDGANRYGYLPFNSSVRGSWIATS